jgi:hypothetical protein
MIDKNKTYFMYEPYPREVKKLEEVHLGKVLFLRSFIVNLGISSLKKKGQIKVPIQSVIRKPIGKGNLHFARKLQHFRPKPVEEEPRFKKELPVLESRRKLPMKRSYQIGGDDTRTTRDGNELYYNPLEKVKFKKYGKKIDSLFVDTGISKISTLGKEIFVDYRGHRGIFTGLRFKNQKEINRLIKRFAKESNVKISHKQPVLNSRLPEGFEVHANYGTEFVPARFTLIRLIK